MTKDDERRNIKHDSARYNETNKLIKTKIRETK